MFGRARSDTRRGRGQGLGLVFRKMVAGDGPGRFRARSFHTSNMQYNTCELKFRGSAVRWFGSKNKDHGFADVYLDGVLQKTVDAYNGAWISNVVLFEKTGLIADRLHTLRIVVRKERNPEAIDCYQDVDCFEVVSR